MLSQGTRGWSNQAHRWSKSGRQWSKPHKFGRHGRRRGKTQKMKPDQIWLGVSRLSRVHPRFRGTRPRRVECGRYRPNLGVGGPHLGQRRCRVDHPPCLILKCLRRPAAHEASRRCLPGRLKASSSARSGVHHRRQNSARDRVRWGLRRNSTARAERRSERQSTAGVDSPSDTEQNSDSGHRTNTTSAASSPLRSNCLLGWGLRGPSAGSRHHDTNIA